MIRLAVLLSPLAIACIPNDTLVLPGMVDSCSGATPQTLRVASYNVKSGAETSLAAVGDTIAQIAPDVIALQEVNVDFKGEDQVRALAGRVGAPYIYAAALSRGGSHTYGIALISKLPIEHATRINLRGTGQAEPRVAIDATLCAGTTELRVLATHADVWKPDPDVKMLAAHLDPLVASPTIVLGDLNVKPDEGAAGMIASHGLTDLIAKYAEGPTFWSDNKRLDYLFVDASLAKEATGATIGQSHASDHLPVWADFALATNP